MSSFRSITLDRHYQTKNPVAGQQLFSFFFSFFADSTFGRKTMPFQQILTLSPGIHRLFGPVKPPAPSIFGGRRAPTTDSRTPIFKIRRLC
jgi:hypothetical protein